MHQGEYSYEAGATFVESGSQVHFSGIFSIIQRYQDGNLYNDGSLCYHETWHYDSQGYGNIVDQITAGYGWEYSTTTQGIFYLGINRNANAGIHYHLGSLQFNNSSLGRKFIYRSN